MKNLTSEYKLTLTKILDLIDSEAVLRVKLINSALTTTICPALLLVFGIAGINVFIARCVFATGILFLACMHAYAVHDQRKHLRALAVQKRCIEKILDNSTDDSTLPADEKH